MKKVIIIILAVFSFAAGYAQKKESPVKEVTFKVDGVCGMCKNRIESTALRTKGVKLAEWNKKTKDLKLVYNSNKVSEQEVHEAIAMSGHQTTLVAQDTVAYQKLPGCCQYKSGAECKKE